MDDTEFAEQVREELGESADPWCVAKLFQKDIPDLLRWFLEDNLWALAQVAKELVLHAEAYKEGKDKERLRGVLHLGVRMLEGRCKLDLFVLKEIKRRLETVDASFDQASELPAGEDKLRK